MHSYTTVLNGILSIRVDWWNALVRLRSVYYIYFHCIYHLGGLAQSVECDVRNVEAEGSKPSFSSFFDSREYDELQSETHIMTWSTTKITDGGLAQLVECVVSNDEAPGSKPGFSTFSFSNSCRISVDCSAIHAVNCVRGISSIGRVRALQARGTGIETPILHNFFVRFRDVTRISANLETEAPLV